MSKEIKNEIEVKNEVVVPQNNEGNFLVDDMNKTYSSMALETIQDRKDLYNALETCDVLLNDVVNTEIMIKDVYVEEREVLNEDTGEVQNKYRTIIFDLDGKTYATGAYGVYNSIKKLMKVYGLPTWEEGVKVKVAKKPIKDGKTSLVLIML